jgi:hypothetical protein
MFQRCRISSRRVVAGGSAGAFNEGHQTATLNPPTHRSPAMNATLAFAGVVILSLAAASAQAGTRRATITGPNGASAVRTVERGDGHVTDTATGPNGRTRTRQVDRSASSATATVTHVNGSTTTRDTERSAAGSTTTVTGPRGRTGTVTVSH